MKVDIGAILQKQLTHGIFAIHKVMDIRVSGINFKAGFLKEFFVNFVQISGKQFFVKTEKKLS